MLKQIYTWLCPHLDNELEEECWILHVGCGVRSGRENIESGVNAKY